VAELLGLPNDGSASGTGSPFGFVMFNLTGGSGLDTMYVADNRNGVGGGLQKWRFNERRAASRTLPQNERMYQMTPLLTKTATMAAFAVLLASTDDRIGGARQHLFVVVPLQRNDLLQRECRGERWRIAVFAGRSPGLLGKLRVPASPPTACTICDAIDDACDLCLKLLEALTARGASIRSRGARFPKTSAMRLRA
jgi:hypothetical protein